MQQRMRLLDHPFARFILVGSVVMVANLILLFTLVSLLDIPYLAACALAFFTLNLIGYLLNKIYTFKLGSEIRGTELGRYYAVMAMSLVANLFLMYVFVDGFELNYLVSSTLTSILLACFNFIGHKALTFRNSPLHQSDVLQVSAFFPEHGGGIEAVAGMLAERISAEGLRVTWAAGSPDGLSVVESTSRKNVLVQRHFDPIERHIGLPMPIWSPRSLVSLWRAVGSARVVHLHDYLYVPCMAAMAFARIRRRPVLLTQHIGELPLKSVHLRGLVNTLNVTLGRWMLSSADQVVFVASPVMRFFGAFVRFRRPPALIENGLDHNLYKPDRHRKPNDGLNLLFVGRFVEKKGINLLRESLDIPDSQWNFVGWGPLSPRNWPELPPSSVVLERAPPASIVPLYQQADLLVLPSFGEGFPLVVQEALACGTPVLVGTNTAEACVNPITDCIYSIDVESPGAPARIRERISMIISDREALLEARRSAEALASKWSWDNCAKSYISRYRDIGDWPDNQAISI